MSLLRTRLFQGSRGKLLKRLSGAIMEVTIRNRAQYDAEAAFAELVKGNEAIHRLNGHLRDLLDPKEDLTESRKDGIIESLALLPPRALDRIIRP